MQILTKKTEKWGKSIYANFNMQKKNGGISMYINTKYNVYIDSSTFSAIFPVKICVFQSHKIYIQSKNHDYINCSKYRKYLLAIHILRLQNN